MSLQPLTVQPLVLELCDALLAGLLVLLPMGPLAVHAAVFDEAAGRAVLELDGVASFLAAVGAGLIAINGHAAHASGGWCLLCVEASVSVVGGETNGPRLCAVAEV